MSDKDQNQKNNNEPKEMEYMEADKKTVNHPPNHKEGLEKPRQEGYPKAQIGFVVFIILVIIIIIIGINSDMFGIFS